MTPPGVIWNALSLNVPATDFPDADNTYKADLSDGGGGTVIIEAEGTSGQFTRKLVVQVKMGG